MLAGIVGCQSRACRSGPETASARSRVVATNARRDRRCAAGCIVLDETHYQSLPRYGSDYAYTYNYGSSFDGQGQKNAMSGLNNQYVIPTVSMGWDSYPWNLQSGSWGSKADFKDVAAWVRDSFQPNVPTGRLGKTMVLLDNWNEFGEGHIMNPTLGYGFNYLDAIREVFTSNTAHTDAVPTDQQKARLDTLYPHGDW